MHGQAVEEMSAESRRMDRQQWKCLRRAGAWPGSSGNVFGGQTHGRAAEEMSVESRRMARQHAKDE